MDFLSYVIAFATGAAITVAILIFVRLGAHMGLARDLHEEIVAWRSDDSAARVDNLKLSQEARRAASRFLEDHEQANQIITTALESLVKNTYESIAAAQESLVVNQAALRQAEEHTARLDRLIDMRTPRMEQIPTARPQPAAPTSYSMLDDDAPVTWAQIKAAGERKRAREAAEAPPPPAPAPMSPEPEEDAVESFQPEQEYTNNTAEEVERDSRRFTAFDDVLRRAREENAVNE